MVRVRVLMRVNVSVRMCMSGKEMKRRECESVNKLCVCV